MNKDFRPNANKNSKKTKLKPIYIFIFFLAISTLIAFLFGGYFIGKENFKKQQNTTTENIDQIKINATEFPNNPQNWKTYILSNLDMELKLPKKLTDKGEWEAIESKGTKGKKICLDYKNTDNKCNNEILIISSTTKDYQVNDDSLFNFSSSKGFVKKNQKYLIITSDNKEIELGNEKHKIFNNDNYEIIKILGTKDSKIGLGENYLGAIINTQNKNFPALILIMNINEDLSEYEFDQILKSIQATTNE